jgi:hypothetical protein
LTYFLKFGINFKIFFTQIKIKQVCQNEINHLVRSFYGEDLGYDELNEDSFEKTANNSTDNLLFNGIK